MVYTAELSDTNVRLPSRKALLLKGTGDSLVEPFKIKVLAFHSLLCTPTSTLINIILIL